MTKNVQYGDPLVLDNEILRTTVGSEVHGIHIPGTEDHDEMGIYIEPPAYVFSPTSVRNNYVSRTKPEGERSGPGDTDLVCYSLRRYLDLAVKGNPTVLVPLFAPPESILSVNYWGHELRGMRHLFLSQEAVKRFLGYMDGQYQRMMGLQNKHTPNRPELIAKYGWDTKYGAHALRLAYQGRMIAQSGTLILPMPAWQREIVLSVKQGQESKDSVAKEIRRIRAEMWELLNSGRCDLPEKAAIDEITEWSVRAHLAFWQDTHLGSHEAVRNLLCTRCGNYRDTPNHMLGCASGDEDSNG